MKNDKRTPNIFAEHEDLIDKAKLLIECREVIERLMTWRQTATPHELTDLARALLAKLEE